MIHDPLASVEMRFTMTKSKGCGCRRFSRRNLLLTHSKANLAFFQPKHIYAEGQYELLIHRLYWATSATKFMIH